MPYLDWRNELFFDDIENWAIKLDNGETLYGARSKQDIEKCLTKKINNV